MAAKILHSEKSAELVKSHDQPRKIVMTREIRKQNVKIELMGKRSQQTLEILANAAFAQLEKMIVRQATLLTTTCPPEVAVWCPLARNADLVRSQADMVEHLAQFLEKIGGLAGIVKIGDLTRVFGGRSARAWFDLLPVPAAFKKILKKGKCAWLLLREIADEAQSTAWMLAAQNCHALVKIGFKIRQHEEDFIMPQGEHSGLDFEDYTLKKIPLSAMS